MKKISRNGFTLFSNKVSHKGKEKVFQIHDSKGEELPFMIKDDSEMISLYHHNNYIYKTYSMKENKFRMVDNIIERL